MRVLAALVATTCLALAACADEGDPSGLGSPEGGPQPTTRTATPNGPATADPGDSGDSGDENPTPRVVRTIASGLEVPWGVTFLPDGTALVSERDSTRVLAIDGSRVREVGRIDEASPQGEAGLLGLATSPSYDEDQLVYAYVSTSSDNRVLRMTYDGRRLGEPEPVLTAIPNGFIHDGGRLLFDDDGNLLVSTGEIGEPSLAQEADSLAGKVLRITPDGSPAPGNPVDGSPVWSMGHRNIQGLAFDDRGRLWATEFGQDTWDELNLIEKSGNYGWPVVEGRGDLDEYRNPHVTWSTADASPSGLAFANGSLWAGALRGQRLWEIPLTGKGTAKPNDWFVGDYGRIRTVTVAPNGNLWVTTSNRDGRGDPAPQDDRILEVAID
jgi:glucose/arabinose dehydrogenase